MGPAMSPERWSRLKEIFGTALELPEQQREPFLIDRCGSDAVVDRRETPVGSSDHARHSFRAGATEGSADIDRSTAGAEGSAAGHTTGSNFPGVADS